MIKESSIYIGNVIHKRFKPKIHFFKYKVFSILLDLSEINLLDKSLKIFSHNKFNIISFYDVDHGPRDGTSLKKWVIKNLIENQINTEEIKIKLLCYPKKLFDLKIFKQFELKLVFKFFIWKMNKCIATNIKPPK